MAKPTVTERINSLDLEDWKSIEAIFRENPLPGTENTEPFIVDYDNTAEYDHSVGKHRSTLSYVVVPLIDSLIEQYGCSISKAAKHALEHPDIISRGLSSAEGVRAAYYAAKKNPPRVSLDMLGWFLLEADYEGAAMAFRYVNPTDRNKIVLALQEFSNRTSTES